MGIFNMQLFKRSDKTKEEILKNKDMILDVMSESIKDARICPIIQKKCIGKFCEFMLDFKDMEGKPFSRCAYVAAPLMALETKMEIKKLHESFLTIAEYAAGVKK